MTRIAVTHGINSIRRDLWDGLTQDEDLPSQYSAIQFREHVSEAGLVFAAEAVDGTYDAAVYAARMEDDATGYCHPARMLISRDGLRLREDDSPFEQMRAAWRLGSGATDEALAQLRDIAEQLLFPTLLVFTPLETRFLVRPGATEEERASLVGTLIAGLEEYARENGCRSAMVLGTSDSDTVVNRALCAEGWTSALMSKAARFDLTGLHSFSDFTAALPNKKRHRVNSEIAAFESLGLGVVGLDPIDSAEQCARLEAQVMAKYGADKDLDGLVEARIDEARRFGDAYQVFGCMDGSDLIACVTVHASKRRYSAVAYGADHAAIGGRPVYQYLGYYVPLRHALAAGARELCLGFEAYRAKMNRGAVLDGRMAFARAFDPHGAKLVTDVLSFADRQNHRYFEQFDDGSQR